MLPRSPIQMKRNSGGGGGVKKRVRSGGEKQRRLGFRRSGSGLRAGGLFACGVLGNDLCQPDCQSASAGASIQISFFFFYWEKSYSARYFCDSALFGKRKCRMHTLPKFSCLLCQEKLSVNFHFRLGLCSYVVMRIKNQLG